MALFGHNFYHLQTRTDFSSKDATQSKNILLLVFTFFLEIQGVMGIWQSKICQWWFNFKLKTILAIAPADLKNKARFQNGQI
jgi:hypothetical protein